MSTHGTSGDGQGSGIGDGRGGWASPLGAELPAPAEIQDESEDAQEESVARGDGAEGAPSGDGQGGESERGAPAQPDQGTGGVGVVTPADPTAAAGVPTVATPGNAETFLETPRGREMFQDFLAQLARQPAPSEAPDQGGTTSAQGATGTAAPMTASTARPSLPATLPRGDAPSAVPRVVPTNAAPSEQQLPRGYLPASQRVPPWQGPVRPLSAFETGPLPGPGTTGLSGGRSAPTVPAGSARENVRSVPVTTTVTSTGGVGTTGTQAAVSNPAVQAFLMDALNQALRMYTSSGVSSTTMQPPPAATVTWPVTTTTGYVPPVATTSMQGHGGYGPAAAAATPMTMPQTPAYTPSAVSRTAIPSYGGVSINVPSAAGSGAVGGALPPGAFYPPFQPSMVATPMWSSAAGTTAPQVLPGGTTAAMGFPAQGPYPVRGPERGYGQPATASYQPLNYPVVGIPNELRNAVKVIVPFHSESASCERAAAFWRSFEKCTFGMDDQMRLTAFEQCLKGKVGLEWWYNSRIDSFEALRVRFHNRFICQTPAQLWNRLKSAKRNKGESAEEWGDRISTMCEALNYNEPRMRFEFFLDGLRNKQMRAMLNSSMVTSIPEACALLLYKNLHLPVEEEDEFPSEGTSRAESKEASSTQSQVLQQLQLMNQRMLQQQNAGTPQQGQINAVTTAVAAVQPSNGNAGTQRGPLLIRLAPDTRTTEGGVVCGRCARAGHGRELCPRGNGVCNRCNEPGHYSMECNVPGAVRNPRNSERRPMTCFLCGDQGHTVVKCPGLEQIRGLMTAAAGTAAPVTQSQQ